MGRWDWLYELEPVPIKEKLCQELSKHLEQALRDWPPAVEGWRSAAEAERFAHVFEQTSPPEAPLFSYAFHLVRLELEREFEAIDFEMRNEAWRDHMAARDYDTLQFLVQWLVHSLLEIKERSNQALTRGDLVRVVDDLERGLGRHAGLLVH